MRSLLLLLIIFFAACSSSNELEANLRGDDVVLPDASEQEPLENDAIYDWANRCVSVQSGSSFLQRTGEQFIWGTEPTPLFMRASDLGTYLFFNEGYLVSSEQQLAYRDQLQSDIYQISDTFISPAEWHLKIADDQLSFQLQNRATENYIGTDGLVTLENAAPIILTESEGCPVHPEMSLDASGEVQRTTFDDGTLYGFVDTHSHILSNFGFGGGGIFHGAPFHRLGVEHAMGDCELFHAEEGRSDLLGWGFSDSDANENAFLSALGTGILPDPQHNTDGWPSFSGWPTRTSATHQTQYYRWIERAWLSGLRLVVQHAVSNEMFCELMTNPGYQPRRWSCNDMVNIDRQLVEIRNMERYIDAQAGGPGKGFFRVVDSPVQAREVIAQGKLAIVLGIEVPNLFDCYLTPRPDSPECTDEYINAQLDKYYDLGIRVLFPNHKYDNAFTPGDGHRGIIELGNFVTTGHWSNFVEDCPDVQTTFDKGGVQYGGANQPRDEYLSPAPNDPIIFTDEPLQDIVSYLGVLREPSLEGEWCQKATLTDKGRTLINGMMDRGMIPEIDHLPRRSYVDAFQMLEDANYPAAGTHGNTNRGRLYDIGGVSKAGFSRCAEPDRPGAMGDRFRDRKQLAEGAGLYPAEGFGFDLNGLAGIPRPRFGAESTCTEQQDDPVTYPFTSFDGDITFETPYIGERQIDFNTEGMIHIGLVPELIEDARQTGVSDEDLEIVFRSAEGYIQMWERAEERARARR